MSEVPELRELVRGAAERRARRRRMRPLPVLAAVAAAVALFVLLPRGGEPRDEREVPAATPSPSPTPTIAAPASFADARAELEQTYGVFRRPMRASDKPRRFKLGKGTHVAKIQIDWAHARRVAVLGGREEFAVPALWDGRVAMCIVGQLTDGSQRSSQCGAMSATTPQWRNETNAGGNIYFLMLPDGPSKVTVHLKSGKTFDRPVDDNGVMWQTRGFREVTWVDAAGQPQRSRMTV